VKSSGKHSKVVRNTHEVEVLAAGIGQIFRNTNFFTHYKSGKKKIITYRMMKARDGRKEEKMRRQEVE
jgi:hypothetical protein